MERKKLIVEVSVLTQRMSSRETERDVEGMLLQLKGRENGQTTIEEIVVV